MPAEWEPHEATWLAWPHERSDWPGKFAPIPWVYGDIVRRLARVEKVRILVEDAAAEKSARRVFAKCDVDMRAVEFYRHRTNRSWTRDLLSDLCSQSAGPRSPSPTGYSTAGPSTTIGATTIKFPATLPSASSCRNMQPGIVLEGGSIDVNGAGLLLTTEECLLSETVQVRNPGLSRAGLEQYFADYLGITPDHLAEARNRRRRYARPH